MRISILLAIASPVSFILASPHPAIPINHGNDLVARMDPNGFFEGQRPREGDPVDGSGNERPPPVIPGARDPQELIPQESLPIILQLIPDYELDRFPITTEPGATTTVSSVFIDRGAMTVTISLRGPTFSLSQQLHVAWEHTVGTVDGITFGTGAVARMQSRRNALQLVVRRDNSDGRVVAQVVLLSQETAIQSIPPRETISLYNLMTLAFAQAGEYGIQRTFDAPGTTLPMHLNLAPAQLAEQHGLPAPDHVAPLLPILLIRRPPRPAGNTEFGPPVDGAVTPESPGYASFVLGDEQEEDAAAHSNPKGKRALKATRDMPFSQIVALEQQARGGQGESVAAESAQFQLLYYAFQSVQANISAAIFPILDEITNGTNCSLVYTMAWTIWADLTAANTQAAGSPFWNGRHAFDDLEQQYLAKNKLSEDDEQYQKYIAVNCVLIDLYQYAWAKSVAAANSTGLLGQLRILAANLATNDTKIQTSDFNQVNPGAYDTQYFVTYNKTQVP